MLDYNIRFSTRSKLKLIFQLLPTFKLKVENRESFFIRLLV